MTEHEPMILIVEDDDALKFGVGLHGKVSQGLQRPHVFLGFIDITRKPEQRPKAARPWAK